jgi:hypothetical protein
MKIWGSQEIKAITKRYENGETAGMIAATMPGVTRNRIIGLIWRNGVKHVKPYPNGTTSPIYRRNLAAKWLAAAGRGP